MNHSIRQLSHSDQSILWEMLYQSLHVAEGEQAFAREVIYSPELRRYVEGWGRPGDLGFAATEKSGGEVVGAAWLRMFTEDEPGYGYVNDHTPELGMAVMPHQRGQGVGSSLLIHLLESAATVYYSVSLSVSADNPAVRLYKRVGFEQVSINGGSLTMIKSLQNVGTERQRAT
ncbi:MAG: GNAT family N-acetyltransferase [Pyrinomonadaceae bacterium]|nr:GNAT family N-acetyltransferase [Pyrinomonadaceae bacterium]